MEGTSPSTSTVPVPRPRQLPHDICAEVWDEIIYHSEPIDLLGLSETCRYFHDRIAQRNTWIRIVQRMCEVHGLFLPSFPVAFMDLAHLQRAALGPWFWSQRVKKHAAPHIDTEHNQISRMSWSELRGIDDPQEHEFPEDETSRPYLVPGGRYLLAVGPATNSRAKFHITLWDLGVPGSELFLFPRLVATTSFGLGFDISIGFEVALDFRGDELRVAIVCSEFESSLFKPYVASISPTAAEPTFTRLGTAKFIDPTWKPDRTIPIQSVLLHSDRLLVQLPFNFLVWDFIQGVYTIVPRTGPGDDIPVDDHPLHGLGYSTMFTGESFIVVDGCGVRLWRIPTLEMSVKSKINDFPDVGFQQPESHLPISLGKMRDFAVPSHPRGFPFAFDAWSVDSRGSFTPRTRYRVGVQDVDRKIELVLKSRNTYALPRTGNQQLRSKTLRRPYRELGSGFFSEATLAVGEIPRGSSPETSSEDGDSASEVEGEDENEDEDEEKYEDEDEDGIDVRDSSPEPSSEDGDSESEEEEDTEDEDEDGIQVQPAEQYVYTVQDDGTLQLSAFCHGYHEASMRLAQACFASGRFVFREEYADSFAINDYLW